MSRVKKTEIEWSYPVEYDSAINKNKAYESWGIYQISSKFRKKEILLYIGMTFKQNFIHRIKEHEAKWFNKYKGIKFIRFGEFMKPNKITYEIIQDIESCLIFELNPIQNKSNTVNYKPKNEYNIKSIGYRGTIPNELSTLNHLN